MNDWWHVVAITIAIGHATWFRYYYQFDPDYSERDELDIEAGIFLEPLDYSE